MAVPPPSQLQLHDQSELVLGGFKSFLKQVSDFLANWDLQKNLFPVSMALIHGFKYPQMETMLNTRYRHMHIHIVGFALDNSFLKVFPGIL